jgi:hypothetical protein
MEGYTMKADLELVTAYRELQSSDLALVRLYKQLGDDADSKRPYRAAEDRRDDALEALASIPAGSPDGMIAKARALQQPDVEYSNYYAAIAASLADDVLRYFSRPA